MAALEEDVLADVDRLPIRLTKNCEMVITRVLRNVQGTAHIWKVGPSLSIHSVIPGVDPSTWYGVLSRILDGILAISDISEVKSHKLSELCSDRDGTRGVL